MQIKKNEIFNLTGKLIISGVLLFLFLRKTNVNDIFIAIAKVPVLLYFFYILLNFILVIVSSVKWKVLISEYSLSSIIKINIISYFYSLILPGQIFGEIAKAYILGRDKNNISKISASVFVDKVTGIISLLIIGIIGCSFTDLKYKFIFICFMLLILITCFLFFILFRLKYTYTFIEKIFKKTYKQNFINKIFEKFLNLLNYFNIYSNDIKTLSINIILGLLSQFIIVFVFWIISFEAGIYINFIDWCWIQAIMSIALLLPISFGGIGLREGTLFGIFNLIGIPGEKAFIITFVILGLNIILAICGGFLELGRTINQTKK